MKSRRLNIHNRRQFSLLPPANEKAVYMFLFTVTCEFLILVQHLYYSNDIYM